MRFRFPLRTRILLAQVGLLAVLGITIGLLIETTYSASLSRQLEKRGISIAKHIAETSVGPILARNSLALRIAAVKQQKVEEDIVYIFFVSPPEQVIGHTFGNEFPTDLIGINRLEPGASHSIQRLLTEEGPIYDIAVPVAGGGLGTVRLGISALPVEQAVRESNREIMLITLASVTLAVFLAFPLSATVIKPVRRLTRAIEEVAAGNLEGEVKNGGRDEISHLATSFNRMLQSLREAREALLESNRELSGEVARRLQAENRLAAQLNFLSTLLDQLPCPVYFKGLDGHYLGCNSAFESFVGLDKQEIVGRSVIDILPMEGAAHEEIDRELLAHPGTRSYEGSLTRSDGAVRQVLFHKTTYSGENGQAAGIVGVLIDLTFERETERMRSEFVSTAAHEFQTPLAAILGFCELMLGNGRTKEATRREYLAIIQERAEYLSRLVHQLLDFSRIEAGCGIPLTRTLCQVDRLLTRLVQTYSQRSGAHTLQLDLARGCLPVLADEDRLSQVIDNLLSNAVKYSPKGGVIRIETEIAGNFLQLRVKDQGPGLTPEQCRKIFEKFYRVHSHDSAPSGTGLGLFIARSIIEAHGGRIEALSTGEGTCIEIHLPLPGASAVQTGGDAAFA